MTTRHPRSRRPFVPAALRRLEQIDFENRFRKWVGKQFGFDPILKDRETWDDLRPSPARSRRGYSRAGKPLGSLL